MRADSKEIVLNGNTDDVLREEIAIVRVRHQVVWRWKAMTPAQRVARAAQIAATGKKLRAAALKAIGFTSGEIRKLESAARH